MKQITRLVLLISILFSALFLQPPQVVRAANFPAQMNKSFTPISIVAGGTSVLSVTIYNPNSFELTSAHYHDFFPAGITVNNPLIYSNSCGGSVLDGSGGSLGAGDTSFQLIGGTVPRQLGANPGECTVTVEVTSTTPGNLINTIPANELESEGDDGGVIVPITNATPASATLQVATVLPPSLSKSFAPNTIAVGAFSTLTINIINNDPTTTLTETALTDYLPTNLVLANPANPTTSTDCGTGTVTAIPGATSLTLNNAQIGPLRTCTITARVASAVQGAYSNTIPAGPAGLGSIQTQQGVTNASPATANLNVQAFTMTKTFSPASIPAGGTSTLTISILNRANFAYTNVGLYDDLYPLSGNNLEFIPGSASFTNCGGMAASVTNTGLPSTVNNRADFTGGSISSGATCSIQISVRSFQRTPAGSYTNTIPAGRITTAEGATNDQPVSSTLGVTGLSISKSFVPNSIPFGGISRLTITINNPSPLPYSVTSLLDDLNSPTNSYVSIAPTPNTNTTCVGGIVTTGPRTITLNGGTVPAAGSCNFSVDVIGTTVGNNRTNTIPAGRLTTVEGGTNASPATALISITNVLPTSTKAFTGVSGNNQIVAGGTSTLTITLTNPAGATALTNLGFIDNLATTGTGLVFTSLTSNTCGGVVNGAGTQVITLSGGSLAGGSPAHSCSVVVVVTMPLNTNGRTVTNTILRTDITNDQNLRPAANITRTLVIRAVDLQGKTFTPSTFQSGGTSSLVITLQNFTGTPLTVNTLTDNLALPTNSNLSIAAYPPAAAPSTTCTGGTITAIAGTQLITLTGGTIPVGVSPTFSNPGTCTVTIPVTGTLVGGPYTNTIPIGNLTTTQGPSSRTARTATVTIYAPGAGVTLTKAFGTNPVNAGSNSLMTLTISPPADTNLTNFSITDSFPANMVVGNPPSAQVVSGCGGLVFNPAPVTGDTSIRATGGTITTGTNCILRVNVRGNLGGSYVNRIRPVDITNNQNRSIPADVTQTLNVNTISTLAVTKNFQPPVVNPNGLSTLTIYLENSNTSALINASLTDNLPGTAADGVRVAPTPNASTTCGAGVITANPGAGVISMAGGTIPARVGSVNGLCSIRVNIQGKRTSAALPFTYTNNIPVTNVSARNQDTGEIMNSTSPASANLTIATLFINVVKGFDPLTVFGGSASTLSVQLINPNNAALSGIAFTDNMPAGMIIANPADLNVGTCGGTLVGVPGASTFSFSGGSLPASTSCTVTLSATMTANGNLTNTIYAGEVTTFNGASNTQDASATLTNLPGASVSKFFAPNPIYAGQYSLLTITIQNTGNIDLSGMGLIDSLASTGSPNVLIAGGSAPAPVNNCGGSLTADPGTQLIQLVNGVLLGSTSCTLVIPVTSTVPGNYQNTIPISTLVTNEGATNALPARDTLRVLALASLGDFVWNDTNANGIQDAGEPGIAGVTVNLRDSGGNTIDTTTTDANGLYQFTGLTPGTYSVQFVAPGGYTFSPADQGGNDALDSDADTTTGITPNVTLASGENNPTIDAGLYQLASLGDFVWNDTNANGIQDAGEPGIAGVTVNLRDSGGNTIDTTTTDANGLYQFTGLTPGTYSVQFVAPGGYTFSPADQGGNDALDSDADTTTGITPNVTLASGENNPTIDAGLYQLASLGDFVWNDTNANGIQDAGEPGIAGVTVNLRDSGGNTIDTTTTDANGLYQFTGLTPGTYSVQFVAPGGYTFSPADQGGNDALDSDADTTTGITPNVTLASGENNPTIDAGLYQLASLGDFVWNDTNANGIQDAGEPGIAGVTVNLRDSGGNTIDTTTTDANGLYQFTGLTPGTYSVQFVAPGGYTFSPADQGGNDALDSDADTTTGITPNVTLASGENNPTIDAGLYQLASLGDFVWNDTNANGIQDAGEPGIAGVTVNLRDSGGNTIDTTTTDANGLYQFTGLTPGTYSVQFVAPGGYTFSPADQGGNDALDSDADTTTGITPNVTLASGENNPTIDAGLYQLASLGDFVWNDTNANGIQDAGEPGIAGVTVNLRDSGGNTIDTTTTDANGLYQFTGLTPGTYSVQFVAPGGYTFSPADQGGNDALDSDADTTTGITPNVTLASGENNPTIDAGLYQPEINVTKVLSAVTFTNPDIARMTYTITIGPNAIPLTAIQAVDDLEDAFTPQTFSVFSLTATNLTVNSLYDGLTVSDTNLLIGTDSLDAGEIGVITLVVDLTLNTNDPTATYVNEVIASGLPPTGPRVSDNSSATGPLFADPAVTKTGDPTRVFVGELVTFTLTVSNNGNQTATDVVVVDPLPSNMSVVSAVSVPTHTVTIIPPRTVQVDIGDMDPDDVVTITIVARVNSTGTPPIINQVELTTTSPTDFDPNNRSSITLEVLQPSLPETGFAPGKLTRIPAQPPSIVYSTNDELSLSIPSLKIHLPIVGVPKSGDSWDVTWLGNRAGWLNGTSYPTWDGNSVITGHVYLSNGLAGPFLNIGKLNYGDRVIVRAYGKEYTYEVRSVRTIKPYEVATALHHEDRSWITLLTCKGFNEDSGNYDLRTVVRAVLVSVK